MDIWIASWYLWRGAKVMLAFYICDEKHFPNSGITLRGIFAFFYFFFELYLLAACSHLCFTFTELLIKTSQKRLNTWKGTPGCGLHTLAKCHSPLMQASEVQKRHNNPSSIPASTVNTMSPNSWPCLLFTPINKGTNGPKLIGCVS